jgi:mono/diheme cytochrome c family protein
VIRLLPTATLLLAGLLVAGACAEQEPYPPPDPARRVELADSLYSTALFDTIPWSSEAERIDAGNLVFADHCRRCHGPLGEGGLARVAGRELVVPSLLQGDWVYEDEPEAVRRRVFTGHTGGMPSWGISRLTPREIDAVAFYLLEQLRPEMAERGAPLPLR